MKHIVCTIASENYAPYVGVLAKSLIETNPEIEVCWLIVDRKSDFRPPASWNIKCLFVEDLGIPDYEYLAFVYSIVEWNTNVKPTFIKYLLELPETGVVTYLDPDIMVFNSLKYLLDLHCDHDILLTPHAMSPVPVDYPYEDRLFLKSGIWNLGFVSFTNSEESKRILSWWENACLGFGFNDAGAGVFVDQKWANIFQAISTRVGVVRNSGYNVAYWNLFERPISNLNGAWFISGVVPLTFYHFSGYKFNRLDELTTHTPGFSVQEFGLTDLFYSYRNLWASAKSEVVNSRTDYSFGSFYSGRKIPDMIRRLALGYSISHKSKFNPFDDTGDWLKFLRKSGFLTQNKKSEISILVPINPRAMNRSDFRLRLINRSLRLALILLGLPRYELLMRYLSYINNGRNQNYVFFEKELVEVKLIKARN
jgi:hypothetical protein